MSSHSTVMTYNICYLIYLFLYIFHFISQLQWKLNCMVILPALHALDLSPLCLVTTWESGNQEVFLPPFSSHLAGSATSCAALSLPLKVLHVSLLGTSPAALIQATLTLSFMPVHIKTMESMISLLSAGSKRTDKLQCSGSILAATYLVCVPNFYYLSVERYIQQTDGWDKSQLKIQKH